MLLVATATVAAGLAVGSAPWPAAAAVVALLLGYAAAKIVHSELVQSRREHAADRAAQAAAYDRILTDRAAAQARFVDTMSQRLAERDQTVGELQVTLRHSERCRADAELRVKREARRANEASDQAAWLQASLEEVRRAAREREEPELHAADGEEQTEFAWQVEAVAG